MPRPTNTHERRTQIAHALLRRMAVHGYDGTSVAEIAREAGLAPGLVHYHFKDKHAILLAALQELVARYQARIEQRVAAVAGDPVAEIAAVIDAHLGLGADADPEMLACWILFSGEALRDPEVRLAFEAALAFTVDLLVGSIQKGMDQRVFACASARESASALVATFQGCFVLAATARPLIPPGSSARAARQMANGLLRPTRSLEAS